MNTEERITRLEFALHCLAVTLASARRSDEGAAEMVYGDIAKFVGEKGPDEETTIDLSGYPSLFQLADYLKGEDGTSTEGP